MKGRSAAIGTSSWGRALRALFAFKHGPWRWKAGLEAAVSSALPMAAFLLAGRLPLGLIASLGAFTALYGTTLPDRQRLRVLPVVGAGFVVASALGAFFAAHTLTVLACLVAVTLLASILVFSTGLGPPGPMQFLLVSAISARLAAPAYLGVADSPRPIEIPVLVAIGAIASYLVVAAPVAFRSFRNPDGETATAAALHVADRFTGEQWTITMRVVLAVVVAATGSLVFQMRHGYWMMMVAGAVLQSSRATRHSALRAVQRVVGTMLGVLVFELIQMAAPQGVWLIATLTLLQFLIELVVARNYAVALTFITPTALTIAAAAGTSTPSILAGERLVDTLLGAMVALGVLWATRSDRPEDLVVETP